MSWKKNMKEIKLQKQQVESEKRPWCFLPVNSWLYLIKTVSSNNTSSLFINCVWVQRTSSSLTYCMCKRELKEWGLFHEELDIHILIVICTSCVQISALGRAFCPFPVLHECTRPEFVSLDRLNMIKTSFMLPNKHSLCCSDLIKLDLTNKTLTSCFVMEVPAHKQTHTEISSK